MLKDTWTDLENAVSGVEGSGSDVSVEPINDIAHAVIDLENKGEGVTNGKSPYIGENGNWYQYDDTSKIYIDTGIKAAGDNGYTPQRGIDYWTEGDKEEIKAYVDDAILRGAW